MAEKAQNAKAAPMTYETLRAPNFLDTVREASETGEPVQVAEPESTGTAEITPAKRKGAK